MKNKILIILIGIFLVVALNAQNCTDTRAQAELSGNDVRARFLNGGDMFWDGASTARFVVPNVNPTSGAREISTLFAGALWLGGYDNGDDLVLAAQTYRAMGNDYWAGPLDPSTGNPVNNGCTDFDKIWSVNRWAIEVHMQDFNDNGQIDDPVDPSILRWPAKGNPQFTTQMGFSLPNQDLAPFYDRNQNGLYEPTLGDFPVFEHGDSSAIADQVLWYVFNDNGNIHTQTNGKPLKAEVQITAYSFTCTNDSLLNRTIFVKNKIINRNSSFIRDFKAGIWTDPDLGCPNDDYVGTVPSMNTVYAYNAYPYDDIFCNGYFSGYGANPPVQAITILNHNLDNTMYHLNGNNGPQVDPQNTLGYYRLLNGRWLDSTALTIGGDGYNNGSTNFTNFVFPDHPLDANGWSAFSQSLSPLDRRIIATVAKDTLYPNESFEVDVAYSYHRNNDSSNIQNVNLMYQQLPLVQQFYDNKYDMVSCTRKDFCVSNCIYPGDMNNNGIANDFDLLEWGQKLGQYAIARRKPRGIDWWPYNPPFTLVNAHADASGNGLIEDSDWDVNTLNWGRTNSLYTGVNEGVNTVGTDLFFTGALTFNNSVPVPNFSADTAQLANNVYLDIFPNIGDTNQLVNNLHSFTTRIEYDTAVFEFNNSLLNSGWIDGKLRLLQDPNNGLLHLVIVRTTATDTSGYGDLNRVVFKIKPTAPVNQLVMTSQICFKDFKAIDSSGNTIPIGAQCYTMYYQDTNAVFTSTPNLAKTEIKDYQLSINPNPVTNEGQLAIKLLTATTVKIQLLDITGKQVAQKQSFSLSEGKHNLPLSTKKLANGVYFCRVWVNEEPQIIKFIKLK